MAMVLGLMLAPSPAWAHGDQVLFDGTVTVPAGGWRSVDGSLHYHRLVGAIQADGPVVVELRRTTDANGNLRHGPAQQFRFNDLVACCDDEPWAHYELVFRNPGDVPVTVRGRVRLTHDDLAVMAYMAESGARETPVIMGVAWIALLWWALRRRALRPTLGSAAVRLAGTCVVVVGLSLWGAVRYGGPGAPALVAALGDVPIIPINPVVSRASLMIGAGIVLWAVAALRWAGSRPSARTETGRGPWLLVGTALVGAVVATAVLIADAYGRWEIAAALAVATGLPVLVVAVQVLSATKAARSPA